MGYMMILNWTPVLSLHDEDVPHGMVFSTMMMCCLIGSSLSSILSGSCSSNALLMASLLLSAGVMCFPAFVGINKANAKWNLWAFLCFEIGIGMYFPTIGILKSQLVEERTRSAVYNILRAPMSAIVFAVLIAHPSVSNTFVIIFALLAS